MACNRKKVAIIGTGGIGSTLALLISREAFADVVVCDVTEGVPEGRSLDICQSAVMDGCHLSMSGASSDDYSIIADADVCVVTAGIARKPGMSRDDLLSFNSGVMKKVGDAIAKHAPKSFVICVTNPLDAMAFVLLRSSGLDSRMVVGMAGVLDAARFIRLLSDELKVSPREIQSIVLGGHGDSMVPMIRYTSVGGIPLLDAIDMGLISKSKLDEIIQKVRDGGAEIVHLLKTGSAIYAPANAVFQMLKSYMFDQRRLLCCSVLLSGEYGQKGIYFGCPVVIGSGGVKRILEIPVNENEKKDISFSADKVRELIEICQD